VVKDLDFRRAKGADNSELGKIWVCSQAYHKNAAVMLQSIVDAHGNLSGKTAEGRINRGIADFPS